MPGGSSDAQAARPHALPKFEPVYLAAPDSAAMSWETWQRLFKLHLVGTGLSTAGSDEQRRACLYQALGAEGARIAAELCPESDNFEETMTKLDQRFGDRQSLIFARTRFYRRYQTDDEDILRFVTELRKLAARCKFGHSEAEHLRDRLVAGCCDEKIRERLFLESDDVTLDDALKIAQTVEGASSEAKKIGAHASNNDTDSVQQLRRRRSKSPPRGNRQGSHAQASAYGAQRHSHQGCGGCGGDHDDSKPCPAKGKKCNACGKRNHFAVVCRSSSGNVFARPSGSTASKKGDGLNYVNVVHAINQPRCDFRKATVKINDRRIRLFIDLGAQVSVLHISVLKAMHTAGQIVPTTRKLHAYGGTEIDTLGTITLSVSYSHVELPAFEFFVVKQGNSLMGLNLFDALGFEVRDPTNELCAIEQSADASYVNNASLTIEAQQLLQSSPMLRNHRELLHVSAEKQIRHYVHSPVIDVAVTPVVQRQRRLPMALTEKVKVEVDRLVNERILEPIESSPWVCNMVIVPKANGAVRICADLSDANRAVVPDRYPLPTIEELSDFFAGSKFFSKVDLKWGYLQVELVESARYITAMITPWGLFQWRRLPFGLSSAPSCFQKIIASIVQGIDGVRNLLDDIVICGKNKHEHDERLLQVLQRLDEYNVTINAEKTVLSAQSVDFVGHHVSADGVRPLQSNVDAILQAEPPVTLKQLRSFLGACNFYRKFIKSFSDVTEPLNLLLRKDARFEWTPLCQRAFELMKSAITQAPTLAHFDADLPTMLTTDASLVALGAVLSQIHPDGSDHPVAFASRTISDAERNYSAGEREALACIWAAEHFHFYLYGRQFTLRTDHSSLTTLLAGASKGHKPMRLLRWADRLAQYSFNVEYRPGRLNAVADYLSRPDDTPVNNNRVLTDGSDLEREATISTIFGNPALLAVTPAELAVATSADDVLARVLEHIKAGWPRKRPNDMGLQAYFHVASELSSEAGVVYRGDRAVVPASLRHRILQVAHEGHPGICRMQQRLREAVWWPAMGRDAERHVKNCEPCLLSGKSLRAAVPPMQPIGLPPQAWHTVAVDIKGPLHGAPESHRFLIVAYDLYAKWPTVYPTSNVSSMTVIRFLKQLFGDWGLPKAIITDNGGQFVSAAVARFLQELGIEHRRTALYHPQANGAVERFNRVITDALRLARIEQRSVSDALFSCVSTYRATPQATTGKSPAELMTGRRFVLPLDRLARVSNRSMPFADDEVRQQVDKNQRRQKHGFDTRNRAEANEFHRGQKVHVRANVRPDKFTSFWTSTKNVASHVAPNTVRLDDGTVRNQRDLVVPPVVKQQDSTSDVVRSTGDLACSSGSTAIGSSATKASSVTEPPKIAGHADAAIAEAQAFRRSQRDRHPPAYLGDYACTIES